MIHRECPLILERILGRGPNNTSDPFPEIVYMKDKGVGVRMGYVKLLR